MALKPRAIELYSLFLVPLTTWFKNYFPNTDIKITTQL